MKKIMFNDRFGLTKAILEERKTQTRRLALHSKEDIQILDELNLKPEDKAFRQYVIDRYSPFKPGETISVAQSYKSIHDTIPEKSGNFGPVHLDMLPKIYIKGLESLIETAKNSRICEVLKHQDKSEIIPDTGIREYEIPAPENQSMFRQTGENAAKEFSEQFKKQDNLPDLVKDTYFDTFSKTTGWKNKMFVRADLMPHQIRIMNIHLEHLQDISDEDCIKEGIIEDCPGVQYSFPTEIGYCGQYPFDTPKAAYAALIDNISGKGTWKKNPWVFVYDFELVK